MPETERRADARVSRRANGLYQNIGSLPVRDGAQSPPWSAWNFCRTRLTAMLQIPEEIRCFITSAETLPASVVELGARDPGLSSKEKVTGLFALALTQNKRVLRLRSAPGLQ